MTHLPATPDVLVVGAGPAGLVAAVALARHGVEVLLVERRAGLSTLPRATTVSLRTMELLRSWGLEDAVRAGGPPNVEWTQWNARTLAEADAGIAVGTGLPTRAESAHLSPTAPACVPQDHLEPVLLDHLRSFSSASVAFGTEALQVDVDADRARVVLGDGSGRRRTVRARHLVAADGAYSRVRAQLGIAMEGPDRVFEAVSALFRAPLWELAGEHRHGLYVLDHPEAQGLFLPAGPTDRWAFGVVLEPGAPALSEADLVRRIRAAAGVPDLPVALEQTGRFTCGAQVAERFRAGRAFLVGDAAHRATPRGGTGMNTGIHDAYDLGWKLAWVLAGWAAPALLDTYEAERRPVAAHNVERSLVEGIGQDLHADLGGRIAHVPLADGRSTLDLPGPGLTVLTAGAPVPPVAAAVPVGAVRLPPIAARALGIPHGGALLVRPDGTPAATVARPEHLAAAVATATGRKPAAG